MKVSKCESWRSIKSSFEWKFKNIEIQLPEHSRNTIAFCVVLNSTLSKWDENIFLFKRNHFIPQFYFECFSTIKKCLKRKFLCLLNFYKIWPNTHTCTHIMIATPNNLTRSSFSLSSRIFKGSDLQIVIDTQIWAQLKLFKCGRKIFDIIKC